MKKIIFSIICLAVALPLFAQSKNNSGVKYGYINTETILNALPEYKSATNSLETLSKSYQSKVENEFAVIEKLYNTYQSQKSSLSAQQRQARENEIITKERAAKQLQQSYFGEDGLMQKKSEELLGPIRKKVQNAIDKLATSGNYMIIFDTAIMQGIVYSNPSNDMSNEVIRILKSSK